MNAGGADGLALAQAVKAGASRAPHAEFVVAPPTTLLSRVSEILAGSAVAVAGQNLHEADSGAFTGEASASMLKFVGCTWVIIGHSERRQYFNETDASVAAKTATAYKAGLLPIVCIGETLAEREAGATLSVVGRQLDAVLSLLAANIGVGAIAYEPVWAIGTGKVASPEQAQEVHAAIRAQLARKSPALAEQTRVLYGGSVKASNAAELLGCADIDGALIGGASLIAEDFLEIGVRAR
jgi:triosephosphate isomerase